MLQVFLPVFCGHIRGLRDGFDMRATLCRLCMRGHSRDTTSKPQARRPGACRQLSSRPAPDAAHRRTSTRPCGSLSRPSSDENSRHKSPSFAMALLAASPQSRYVNSDISSSTVASSCVSDTLFSKQCSPSSVTVSRLVERAFREEYRLSANSSYLLQFPD